MNLTSRQYEFNSIKTKLKSSSFRQQNKLREMQREKVQVQQIDSTISIIQSIQDRNIYKLLHLLSEFGSTAYHRVVSMISLSDVEMDLLRMTRTMLAYGKIHILPGWDAKECYLEMMRVNSLIYRYLPKHLQNDEEILEIAKKYPKDIYDILPYSLRENYMVIYKALKKKKTNLAAVPDHLYEDKKFRKIAVMANPSLFEQFNDVTFTAKEMKAMITENGEAYRVYMQCSNFSHTIEEECYLLKLALKTTPNLYKKFAQPYMYDRDLLQTVLFYKPRAFIDLEHPFTSDLFFIKIFLTDNFSTSSFNYLNNLTSEEFKEIVLFALENKMKIKNINEITHKSDLKDFLLKDPEIFELMFTRGVTFDMNNFMEETCY